MINNVKKNRFIRNYLKDKYLIAIVIGIILFWSCIYLISFYKPKYISQAKVLIKDNSTETFVTDLDKTGEMQPLTQAGNPLLTQIELLKSQQLSDYLFDYIQDKYPDQVKNIKNRDDFISSFIKANNKIGTDVINISLSWDKPENAKEFLKVVIDEYQNINLKINQEIRTNRRKYIDTKIGEIENRLINVRNKIKLYKTGALAINLDEQSKALVNQKVDFTSRLAQINADIYSSRGTIREIQKQLSLNTKDAIDAVALGSDNKNLVDLRSKLDEITQQYEYDLVKNTSANPKMIALKNQIDTIKDQIQNQIELTIGKPVSNQITIFDPVRTKLVSDLATAQTNFMSLKAQKNSILNSISGIDSDQSALPVKKYTLDNLEQEERNLSTAYDELSKKQIEAKIKEAEAVSNVIVIDHPSTPVNEAFPARSQVLLMALILGAFLGLTTSTLKTYIEDICEGIESIEELTGKTVLGVIPWFGDKIKSQEGKMIRNMAYGNILSNLMIRCYNNNANSIAFSATNIKKNSSKTVYTIASELIKIGHSVVVIDADLRTPTLHKLPEINGKLAINLSDLILSIENKFKQQNGLQNGLKFARRFNNNQNTSVALMKPETDNSVITDDADITEIIRNAISISENGVAFLANKVAIKDPYEFFGTDAFKYILEKLKANFDWVLIETPSISIAPETLLISKRSDAFALITGLKVTNSTLSKVINTLKRIDVPLLGCIIRDKDVNIKEHLEIMK